MDDQQLVKILSELGHETRLGIFKTVIQYGEEGIKVGSIAQQLELAPSTLNFHLNRLVEAGVIRQDKQGREIYCYAVVGVLNEAVDLLLAECCAKTQCGC